MGKKSDNAEMLRRVEEVLRIRLDGAQFHDIVQYGSEKGWGVTDRQVRKYIARADQLLVERQEKNRRRLLAKHLAQREALFARAVNAADLRTALAILADTAKLQALYTNDRDLKELARLVTGQNQRIQELEARLADARRDARPRPEEQPPAGAVGTGDAGGPGR